jgi:hypothetical protein
LFLFSSSNFGFFQDPDMARVKLIDSLLATSARSFLTKADWYTSKFLIQRSGNFFAFFFVFFSHPHVNRTLLSDRRTPEVLTRWSFPITTAGACTFADPPPTSALLSLSAILFPQAPEGFAS